MPGPMETLEIQSILPHRFPFLLVDRVVSMVPSESIRAFKNVSINEHFFEGHFPSQPVMPGVLIVEALAQAGAILAIQSSGLSLGGKVVYLIGLDGVRFRKPVVPGDRLDLEVAVIRGKGKIWKMRGEAKVDGKVVCEAELLATLGDRGAPAEP
jgi:3-hydroxyacyl-[acyl-carrier-protein] dehydratase